MFRTSKFLLLTSCFAIAALAVPAAQRASAWRGRAQTADGRPARDAVIWIDAPNAPATPQTARVVLDQRNLTFSPHVLIVRVGTAVEFPNHDRVFHNVFSFHDGKKFDLGTYPVGTMRRVTFDRAGMSRIFCNIHPNMAAYVVAVDSPYFTRVGDDGAFAIDGVPAGVQTYHAWRPGAEDQTGRWSPASGPLTVTLK